MAEYNFFKSLTIKILIFHVDKSKKSESTLKNLLSGKSIFFYPGIVMSAGWTIINIMKMFNYIG